MTYSKKFISSFLGVLALGGLAVKFRPAIYHTFLEVKVHASSPTYTLYQHFESSYPDASRPIVTSGNKIVAQRSDGSRVVLENATPRLGYRDRRISLSSGRALRVYDEIKVVSTSKLDSTNYLAWLGAPMKPDAGCTIPTRGTLVEPAKVVTQDVFFGIPTNKVRMNDTSTLWMAPGLNCEILKRTMTISGSDPGVATEVTDKIVYGEPDPALFVVGTDYQELPPSEAVRKRMVNKGNFFSPDEIDKTSADWKRMDQKYYLLSPDPAIAQKATKPNSVKAE